MPDSRSKSLVQRLPDNPMLPAYVQRLDSPTLGKLIEPVAPQDAQELLVLATSEQMQGNRGTVYLFRSRIWMCSPCATK